MPRGPHLTQVFGRTLGMSVLAAMLVAPTAALAAVRPQAVVKRSSEPISSLSFSSRKFPMSVRELDDGQVKLTVRLTGEFSGRKSKLLLNKEPVPVDSGRFEVELTIRQANTDLEFSTVNIFGIVKSETVTLESTPADPVRELLKGVQSKTTSWSIGLSTSLMEYSDNSGETLSQYGLGAKFSYSAFLTSNRNHVLAGNVYSTFLPVSRSRADTDLRVIGANLRYGYFLGNYARWKFWIYGGYFYTTTISQGGRIGFTNLLGPQLYPTASTQLDKRRSLAAYFKLAPLYGVFDLASREMAFGASFTTRPLLGGGRTWSLDHSRITLIAGQAEIHLTSTVLGYSIGF